LPKQKEFIFVYCHVWFTNKNEDKKVYRNIHAVVRRKPDAERILKSTKTRKQHLNVLMFGIDSVSRMNFIRCAPKTHKHLEDTGWFQMEGYNKVCMKFLGCKIF
jgi:hypothetical protein